MINKRLYENFSGHVLVFGLLLGLAACGSGSDSNTETTGASSGSTDLSGLSVPAGLPLSAEGSYDISTDLCGLGYSDFGSPGPRGGNMATTGCTSVYYLSNSGDDANDGNSTTTPVKTMAHMNTISLSDGACILFNRGDTFRGELALRGEPDQITIGTYGSGSSPVLKGSEQVKGWALTSHPSLDNTKVYEADVSFLSDKDIEFMFANDNLLTLARYPNVSDPSKKNWLRVGSAPSNPENTITDGNVGALNKPDNYWVGALIRIRDYSWTFKISEITASSAAGALQAKSDPTDYAEWGYYLDNKLEELDHPGEWYHDKKANKVYLYPPSGIDPNTDIIDASVYDSGINIGYREEGMTVQDLTFKHYYGRALNANKNETNGSTVEYNAFDHNSISVYTWSSKDIKISHNLIENSFDQGITLAGGVGSPVVEYNRIKNTGMYPGYGGLKSKVDSSGFDSYLGEGIKIGTDGFTIQYNTIENTSHAGIYAQGAATIQRNVICKSLLVLNDGGGISVSSDDITISENFILDSVGNIDESNGVGSSSGSKHSAYGMGIGADSNNRNITVSDNTIANMTDMGIRFNAFINSSIQNNVVYNADPGIALEANMGASNGLTVSGNTVVTLGINHEGLTLRDDDLYGTIENNFFCNPFSKASIRKDGKYYGIPHWRSDFNGTYDASASSECDWSTVGLGPGVYTEYDVTATGSNLIANSTFDSGVDEWSTSAVYDSTNQRLKVNASGAMVANAFSLTKDQVYQLKLDVVADSGQYGNLQVRINDTSGSTWQILDEIFLPYNDTVQTYEHYFKAPQSTSEAKIVLTTRDYDEFSYYIDNITFTQVTATKQDATQKLTIFMNATGSSKTISTAGYKTLSGGAAPTSLNAYRSVVLVKQ